MKLRHAEQGARGRVRAQGTHQNPVTLPLLSSLQLTAHTHSPHAAATMSSLPVCAPAPRGSETGGSLEISTPFHPP